MIGNSPLIVSYGVGRDSTAMLIELYKRGIRPDAITFANVGSEKKKTYEYIPVIRRWLKSVDFPDLTIVRYKPKLAPYNSLEGNMVLNATLPGATFNMGTCTHKFKIEPQNRWTQQWEMAQAAWADGRKVIKMIGFECDETHRLKRADAKAHSGKSLDTKDRERYEYQFPLMDWGYDLEKCKEIIDGAGLPIPIKSACYFCPNQKPEEVDELSPEDRARIILIELTAEPYNKKIRGLWRRPRKSDGRPGSITEYILEKKLPFTPLTSLGKRIVLNAKCQKAKSGGQQTFAAPHVGPRLSELLIAAGHDIPAIVVPEGDTREVEPGDYAEDCRDEADYADTGCDGCSGCGDEHDQHMELIAGI